MQKDNYAKLASLSVFRELYNADQDIYSVIGEFLKEVIYSKALYSFTNTEIADEVNKAYNFDLPISVIKTSLKRVPFVERAQGKYYAKIDKESKNEIRDKRKNAISETETIAREICDYIGLELKKRISNAEKIKIKNSLCSFLLDSNTTDQYSDLISAYILKKKDGNGFAKRLNKIKEGVILYTGLMFTDPGRMGSWKKDLTIFLDTEILFHIGGFNGEVFQRVAQELINLVCEMNRKYKRDIIKLKYFKEAKKEIEKFFNAAEMIIDKKSKYQITTIAMENIVKGCHYKSDILGKKSDFYTLLKNNNIYIDDKDDYFENKNHKYNIIDNELIIVLKEKYGADDLSDNIRLLDYINIYRKGKSTRNFDEIGYILVTGNSLTLKLSSDELICKKEEIYRAISLEYIVNKLWYTQNKGFGSDNYPSILSIYTKARIVLSKHLSDSLSDSYEEVKKEYKEGRVTEEQLSARIIDLKQKTKSPENVTNDNIDEILEHINDDNLERFCEEQEHFKRKAKENEALVTELQKKHGMDLQEKEIDNRINSLEEQLSILEKMKNNLDRIVEKRISRLKIISILLCSILYFVPIVLWYKLSWSFLEPIFYFIGLLPSLFMGFYFIVREKTINPKMIIDSIKENIEIKIYAKYMFDFGKYKKLKEELYKLNLTQSKI